MKTTPLTSPSQPTLLQRLGRLVPPPLAALPLAAGWRVAEWLQSLPIPTELHGRVFEITVRDLGLCMRFTCQGSHLQPSWKGVPELKLAASLSDFMRMAAGDIDADTLFFQRRLSIEGDTELGLIVKNWLDAVERPPRLVALIHVLIQSPSQSAS